MAEYNFRWYFLGALSSIVEKYFDRQNPNICEWGAGYSTYILHGVVAGTESGRLVSVEGYDHYAKEVYSELPYASRVDSIVADVFDVDRVERNFGAYYTTAPLTTGMQYGLMLVDGRCRAECLLVAALAISRIGVVVLDDSVRLRYALGLALFEELDTFHRFKVLRVRPELKQLFEENSASLAGLKGAIIATADMHRAGGMGAIPRIPDLAEDSLAAVRRLLGNLNEPLGGSVLCWAESGDFRGLWNGGHLDAFTSIKLISSKAISIPGEEWNADTSITRIKLSLTGNLSDMSKEPALHYSSAPLAYETESYDLIVVAGHRRNECLMTAAFLSSEHTRVLIRDGVRDHYTPGLVFFEEIARDGGWVLAKLKLDFQHILRNLSPALRERTRGAALTDA